MVGISFPTVVFSTLCRDFYKEAPMSNEEIAVQIHVGNRDLKLKLLEQVRRYTWKQVRRWMFDLNGRGGVTEEDLIQAGFWHS